MGAAIVMKPVRKHALILLPALLLLGAPSCGRPAGAPSGATAAAGAASVLDGLDASDPAAARRQAGAGESTGSIVFEKTSVEIGEILQETTRDIRFPFEVQDDAAAITGLNPSCGCTRAIVEVAGEVVPLGVAMPAGTRGDVVATFASQRFRNDKLTSVDVRGNAVNLPAVLKIHATIRPYFDPDPLRIFFGEVPAAVLAEGPRTVRVEVHAAKPFEITEWIRVPEGVVLKEAGREAAPDGGELRRFEAILGEDAPRGRLYQTAVAATSLGVNLEFLIQAEVLGPVRYLPERRISFGIVETGRSPSRPLRILATGPDIHLPEPRIEMVDGIGKDAFTWVVKPVKAGQEYLVRFRILPDAPAGRHTGRVRVSWPEETGFPAEDFALTVILR